MSSTDFTDFKHLFLHDVPLIDVRAPIEFSQGAFPCSINLPLMMDDERAAVGTCYKTSGQHKAIELGHSLVCGEVRQKRTEAWKACLARYDEAYLYCWRGGLRSHIVQTWLEEQGVNPIVIKGGYKALRRYLMSINDEAGQFPMHIVAGNTGNGKTLLINEMKKGIDLEGMAKHRGSSFGRTLEAQSSQVDFEHRLAIEFLKKQASGIAHWIVEDEGRTIGSNHVPPSFYDAMNEQPVVVIEDPFEQRVSRLLDEYITFMLSGFLATLPEEQAWTEFTDYLKHGLYSIRKRLGLERYFQLTDELEIALQRHRESGNITEHVRWIEPLLKDYYDPMYTFQLSKKAQRIVFRGAYSEVKAYLMANIDDV